ncbi:hypothetical protein CHARACLAT_028932 [Characodon lateralis]|uniref:Uncharacterized protein n=1 Tax=Characodon lateralis TaxID=208331 RepID=A0ABU7EF29_9TELE|nr:hypothetical protein [Characodon lateralis]
MSHDIIRALSRPPTHLQPTPLLILRRSCSCSQSAQLSPAAAEGRELMIQLGHFSPVVLSLRQDENCACYRFGSPCRNCSASSRQRGTERRCGMLEYRSFSKY